MTRILRWFSPGLLCSVCGALVALPAAAQDAEAVDPATGFSRQVHYRAQDVVRINTKLRYTTMILLPAGEEILDVTCGDQDFWQIDSTANFAYVKPSKAQSETNINIITASGNVYSFVLTEVSRQADAEPDLKVFVEPSGPGMVAALERAPRFVRAEEVSGYQEAVARARAEVEEARATAAREIDAFREAYPKDLLFDYEFERDKRPWNVEAIYRDAQFTYIRATPLETPAVYEEADGDPKLVNYDFADGLYIIRKIVDRGFLRVGDRRMRFQRK